MGKVKEEIAQYLKKNNYCVLSTTRKDVPRATPVRYWNDGLKIIVLSEKYTAKFDYLKKNTNVSLGIYSARRPVRGLQLWGKAEVITHKDPRHNAYLPARIKKNPRMKTASKILNVIQIVPHKIVMLDQSRKGNHFLCWERDTQGNEKEKEMKSLRAVSKL